MAKQIRPRISEEEYILIKGIRESAKEMGVGLNNVKDGWLKSKNASLRFTNPLYGQPEDLETIRSILDSKILNTYKPKTSSYVLNEGVVKWSDLHFGAYIRNLVITEDFDADILSKKLMHSVNQINAIGFKKVHVHIHGDLIESFSGMNHLTTWMEMDPTLIGANSVILCCKMLNDALSEVNNLGQIKIVSGNHDRTSSRNDEDVRGGAAELIGWGLTKAGYDVEFNPMVITHKVEGINYINLHGHFRLGKKSTDDILWKYGKKGDYNFIAEGHLHSFIEKLTVNQIKSYQLVSDDGIDKRRMHLPSFFPGNFYSESSGFNSNTGYVIVWDNGYGKPNVFNASV